MHGTEYPNVDTIVEGQAAPSHIELLKLLQEARFQADAAGFDLVSIRISEAIDLLRDAAL